MWDAPIIPKVLKFCKARIVSKRIALFSLANHTSNDRATVDHRPFFPCREPSRHAEAHTKHLQQKHSFFKCTNLPYQRCRRQTAIKLCVIFLIKGECFKLLCAIFQVKLGDEITEKKILKIKTMH